RSRGPARRADRERRGLLRGRRRRPRRGRRRRADYLTVAERLGLGHGIDHRARALDAQVAGGKCVLQLACLADGAVLGADLEEIARAEELDVVAVEDDAAV